MLEHSKRIFFSSFLCLLISGFVELTKRKLAEDESYKPFCDFDEGLFGLAPHKCSTVLKSEYSTGFGLNFLPDALKISNSIYGIALYAVIASLSKKIHF